MMLMKFWHELYKYLIKFRHVNEEDDLQELIHANDDPDNLKCDAVENQSSETVAL